MFGIGADAGALRLAPNTPYIYIHLAAHLGLLYVRDSEGMPDGTLTKLLVAFALNCQLLALSVAVREASRREVSTVNCQLFNLSLDKLQSLWDRFGL